MAAVLSLFKGPGKSADAARELIGGSGSKAQGPAKVRLQTDDAPVGSLPIMGMAVWLKVEHPERSRAHLPWVQPKVEGATLRCSHCPWPAGRLMRATKAETYLSGIQDDKGRSFVDLVLRDALLRTSRIAPPPTTAPNSSPCCRARSNWRIAALPREPCRRIGNVTMTTPTSPSMPSCRS